MTDTQPTADTTAILGETLYETFWGADHGLDEIAYGIWSAPAEVRDAKFVQETEELFAQLRYCVTTGDYRQAIRIAYMLGALTMPTTARH